MKVRDDVITEYGGKWVKDLYSSIFQVVTAIIIILNPVGNPRR